MRQAHLVERADVADERLRLDGANGGAHGGRQPKGIPRRAHQQGDGAGLNLLSHRAVHHEAGGAVDVEVTDVAGHADDAHPRLLVRAEPQPPADRVHVAPEVVRQVRVHDHDGRRARGSAPAKARPRAMGIASRGSSPADVTALDPHLLVVGREARPSTHSETV